MHEYSLIQSIVEQVILSSASNGAKSVRRVNIKLGALSHVPAEQLDFWWGVLTEGTIAAGAKLVHKYEAGEIECKSCGKTTRVSHEDVREAINDILIVLCPACESTDTQILSGEEITIEGAEIET